MLKIKLKRSYPKLENGERKLDSKGLAIIVFVYVVTGAKDLLDRYRKIQESNDVNTIVDEVTGETLYFTTNPCGLTGKLGISINDKIFVDTTSMDLANALIKNHGYAGQLMARDIVKSDLNIEATDPATVPEDNTPL